MNQSYSHVGVVRQQMLGPQIQPSSPGGASGGATPVGVGVGVGVGVASAMALVARGCTFSAMVSV